MRADTLSRSRPGFSASSTGTADHVDARAQIRIGRAQLEAAVQIVVADDPIPQRAVELEVRQRLEHDAALVDDAQARRAHVLLQRFHAVGATVPMAGLALG